MAENFVYQINMKATDQQKGGLHDITHEFCSQEK